MNYSDDLSKWQKASVKITQLKWEIEETLIKDFNEAEMESEKYKQLLDTLEVLMEHILQKRRQEREDNLQAENEKLKKQNGWFSKKAILMAATGAAVAQIVKMIVEVILGG